MARQPEETEPLFKDYYQILQLHPDAEAAMMDQAYWHLARLYNAAGPSDSSARAKLDDLNEAYSVLRSPTLRELYDKVRDGVLGQGALPIPPQQEPGPEPPLAVMAKQHPRSRESRKSHGLRWPRLNVKKAGGVLWQSAMRPLATVLLVRKLLRFPTRLTLHRPAIRVPHLPEPRPAATTIDPDTLRQSTQAMLGRWRERTDTERIPPATSPESDESHEPSDTPIDEAGRA